MKFVAPRPFADPEIAARKVVEIANATGSGRPHQTDSLHRSKHRPLFDHLVRGRQLVPVSGDEKRSVPDARAGTSPGAQREIRRPSRVAGTRLNQSRYAGCSLNLGNPSVRDNQSAARIKNNDSGFKPWDVTSGTVSASLHPAGAELFT